MSNSQDLESLVTRVARPPKRRTWQVSLRWLLIVMALCATYFGGRSSRHQELLELKRQQQQAAKQLAISEERLKQAEKLQKLHRAEIEQFQEQAAGELRYVREQVRKELIAEAIAAQQEQSAHEQRMADERRKLRIKD